MNLYAGDAGMYNMRFSRRYPKLVEGSGAMAMVRITQEQLEDAVKQSIELVKFIAGQLRDKESAHARAGGTTPYQAPAVRSSSAIITGSLVAGAAIILTCAYRARFAGSRSAAVAIPARE